MFSTSREVAFAAIALYPIRHCQVESPKHWQPGLGSETQCIILEPDRNDTDIYKLFRLDALQELLWIRERINLKTGLANNQAHYCYLELERWIDSIRNGFKLDDKSVYHSPDGQVISKSVRVFFATDMVRFWTWFETALEVFLLLGDDGPGSGVQKWNDVSMEFRTAIRTVNVSRKEALPDSVTLITDLKRATNVATAYTEEFCPSHFHLAFQEPAWKRRRAHLIGLPALVVALKRVCVFLDVDLRVVPDMIDLFESDSDLSFKCICCTLSLPHGYRGAIVAG
ncbi:hypothetical protein EX30DRAFT_340174 [Ascodesmis nigricans]|uniref:Uncharacterized protein n=1 Tax=Ascodesmis nigricans TaxID=341454 RepID=A0A4V3SJ18_9PEZI|nr:hypothetical protein EX30DRAFT_340174 [Ascodesmis nigricans]